MSLRSLRLRKVDAESQGFPQDSNLNVFIEKYSYQDRRGLYLFAEVFMNIF
jgi:hypothetical protein